MQRESSGAALFWGIVALGAVAMGLGVSLLAGYLLGHYADERTVTETVSSSDVSDGAIPVISAARAGPAATLSSTAPELADIGEGLQGPSNLRASVYARGVNNVQVMTPAPGGGLFAATAAETAKPSNTIFLIRRGERPVPVVEDLGPVVGLEWSANQLYVSTPGTVEVYTDFSADRFGSHRRILEGLPAGRLGFNGDIHEGPDGRMYLAIGSPCDHCRPPDARSATIVSFRRDGSDMRTYATGLRGNAFFAWAPGTSDMFAVTNNRDDRKPPLPDEFGLVRQGDDWGYPGCYRQGGPSCAGVAKPLAYMDAHAASDGLTFLRDDWGAAKGMSTISTEWTLGKVIQTSLTKRGDVYTARPQVAMSGFKNPSGVLTLADGKTVMIADYGSGIVYSVAPGRAPAGGSEATAAQDQEPAPEEPGPAAPKATSTLKAAAVPVRQLSRTTTDGDLLAICQAPDVTRAPTGLQDCPRADANRSR